jgi:ATP-dependent helicase HrpA
VSPAAAADLTEQLGNLVFPGFLTATAYEHITQLPRYLRAAQQRIVGLRTNPARDAAGLATILRIEDAYAELAAAAPPGPLPDFVDDVGWMIEELRVSLFAQSLRTPVPVSEKRVRNALDRARARLDERVPAGGRG